MKITLFCVNTFCAVRAIILKWKFDCHILIKSSQTLSMANKISEAPCGLTLSLTFPFPTSQTSDFASLFLHPPFSRQGEPCTIPNAWCCSPHPCFCSNSASYLNCPFFTSLPWAPGKQTPPVLCGWANTPVLTLHSSAGQWHLHPAELHCDCSITCETPRGTMCLLTWGKLT